MILVHFIWTGKQIQIQRVKKKKDATVEPKQISGVSNTFGVSIILFCIHDKSAFIEEKKKNINLKKKNMVISNFWLVVYNQQNFLSYDRLGKRNNSQSPPQS